MQVNMGMSVRADAAVSSCRDAYSLGGFSHHQHRPGLTNLRQHGKLADVLPVADARYLRARQRRSLSAPHCVDKLRTTTCQARMCFAGIGEWPCFFVQTSDRCPVCLPKCTVFATGAGGGSRGGLFKVCRKGAHAYAAQSSPR